MEIESMLRTYYRELFPLELLYEILEINERREISFFTGTGTYMRYLTFDSPNAFREKLEQINPKKIDLGPIYDVKPAKCSGAMPIMRELVFDIDLTDYPRDCCKDKTVCKLCYEKIKCAIKILDYSLRNEFGFKQYGFVFSGRRGLHCWVLEMKDLSAHVRNNIYKFFQNVIDKHLSINEYNEIMEQYESKDSDLVAGLFPRIDKQVTVSMQHLIKIPFSVHPDTFNISVPLDPKNIMELEDIPTLKQVIEDFEVMKPCYEILKQWKG